MNTNLTDDEKMNLDTNDTLFLLTDAEYLLEVILRWFEDSGETSIEGRDDVDNYRKTAFYHDAEMYYTVLRALRDKMQDAKVSVLKTEAAIDKLGIWNNPKQ